MSSVVQSIAGLWQLYRAMVTRKVQVVINNRIIVKLTVLQDALQSDWQSFLDLTTIADVFVGEGDFGKWFTDPLPPEVELLRALSLSFPGPLLI